LITYFFLLQICVRDKDSITKTVKDLTQSGDNS